MNTCAYIYIYGFILLRSEIKVRRGIRGSSSSSRCSTSCNDKITRNQVTAYIDNTSITYSGSSNSDSDCPFGDVETGEESCEDSSITSLMNEEASYHRRSRDEVGEDCSAFDDCEDDDDDNDGDDDTFDCGDGVDYSNDSSSSVDDSGNNNNDHDTQKETKKNTIAVGQTTTAIAKKSENESPPCSTVRSSLKAFGSGSDVDKESTLLLDTAKTKHKGTGCPIILTTPLHNRTTNAISTGNPYSGANKQSSNSINSSGSSPNCNGSTSRTSLSALPHNDTEDMSMLATDNAQTTIRLQKARISALQAEMRDLAFELEKKDMTISNQKTQINAITAKYDSITTKYSQLQLALDKAKKNNENLSAKAEQNQKEATEFSRQIEKLTRDITKNERENGAKQKRMNKVMEECEKLKEQIKQFKDKDIDGNSDDKREIERLRGALKKVERQRSDLIIGYKKQTQLIDILKKQKIHLEAARMINFTEQEFVRVLEMGGRQFNDNA